MSRSEAWGWKSNTPHNGAVSRPCLKCAAMSYHSLFCRYQGILERVHKSCVLRAWMSCAVECEPGAGQGVSNFRDGVVHPHQGRPARNFRLEALPIRMRLAVGMDGDERTLISGFQGSSWRFRQLE